MITTNRINQPAPKLRPPSYKFGQCSPILSMEEAMLIEEASHIIGQHPAIFAKEAVMLWAEAIIAGDRE